MLVGWSLQIGRSWAANAFTVSAKIVPDVHRRQVAIVQQKELVGLLRRARFLRTHW